MHDTDAIEILETDPQAKNNTFAQSLCAHFHQRHGQLSDKQWYWVIKLAGEAETRQATVATVTATAEQLGDFNDMVALFKVAKESGLKFPKIRLDAGEQRIVLAVCGARSKSPGAIRVTNGMGFHDPGNLYFGQIDTDGRWLPGRDATDEVVDMLRDFATNPEGVAAAYGQRTGSCCFCGRELTDARSTDVGYGPVCADKYGLAWG